ncbi:MAG TPA: hypothetical protein VHE83_07510 [Mycobacteriales bacterium]|nr:hypothetical protein [Mycobacteriales bacterium]
MGSARFDLDDPQTLFSACEGGSLPQLYDQLAREAPLWKLPGLDAVYLACTRTLVEEAIAKPEELSSNLTRVLFREDDGSPALWEMAPLGDPSHALATADPPLHTAHRKLLLPFLGRPAMRAREPFVRSIATELIGAFGPTDADITTGLADPLTMRVICQVVGIPEDDYALLVESVIAMDRLIAGLASRTEMEAGATAALTLLIRMQQYLTGTPPADSLLAYLQQAIADGETSEAEALAVLMQIITAGTETTATLIGRAARHLADDPGLQNKLRGDTSGVPDFLDDVLRNDGPFQFHYRTAREGASLGGQAIPENATVLMMWASSDLTAASGAATAADVALSSSHLAFGRGIHFCIGAHLARLEATVAYEELLTTRPPFEPDPTLERRARHSLMMSRPTATPIRWA